MNPTSSKQELNSQVNVPAVGIFHHPLITQENVPAVGVFTTRK